ncbi:MAG: GntR family transcriptional regulator [Rhizobiaceae bacterium]
MTTEDTQNGVSYVDRIYEQVKSMAATFDIKPGERVNESTLAKELNVSRTPLREALNRLSTEGFLEVRPGKGFFRRMLDPVEIFELFQLRCAIECAGIRLAISKAQDHDIDKLMHFLDETGGNQGHRPVLELVHLDEQYHEELLRMCGNAEFVRVLANINARIRFVRWVDMDRRGRPATQQEHRDILHSLKARSEAKSVFLLERHIERRIDEITNSIKVGFSRIYMGEGPSSSG